MLAHGATWVDIKEFKSKSGKTTTVAHGITAMCCLEKTDAEQDGGNQRKEEGKQRRNL